MNTLFDLDNMDFEDLFSTVEGIEGGVQFKVAQEPKNLFNSRELYTIASSIMNIDVDSWLNLVEVRGMRPVKAAIKLGANITTAQLVGDLKLATGAAAINKVYADKRCMSCMTGCKVGAFWANNYVGVIHSPNFRLLVGLETRGINPRSYGFKGEKVHALLEPFFNEKEFPVKSIYKYKTQKTFAGRKPVHKTDYILTTVESEDIGLKEISAMLPDLIERGFYDRAGATVFGKSVHELPSPFKGTFTLKQRYYKGPHSKANDFRDPLPTYYTFEDIDGEYKVDSNVMLTIRKYVSDEPYFEDQDVVLRCPAIKYSQESEDPFIDFDSETLSKEEGEFKIKELGLVLNSDVETTFGTPFQMEDDEPEDATAPRPLNLGERAELRQLTLDWTELDDIPF